MSEKWKQKILLIFRLLFLRQAGILTAAFLPAHSTGRIAFEHTSAYQKPYWQILLKQSHSY